MYCLGLAYRGTAHNGAISRLLHHAVTDVADDVRRAAVLCLGFVLMGAPEQCPRIVALLAESFNPHMRYGAAMAVGLACAGATTSCGSMLHQCCGLLLLLLRLLVLTHIPLCCRGGLDPNLPLIYN
jgi:hypothetical protein